MAREIGGGVGLFVPESARAPPVRTTRHTGPRRGALDRGPGFRNPLVASMMQLSLLRGPPGLPEGGFSAAVDALEREAMKMSRILNDVVEITKIEIRPCRPLSNAGSHGKHRSSRSSRGYARRAASTSVKIHGYVARNVPDVWVDKRPHAARVREPRRQRHEVHASRAASRSVRARTAARSCSGSRTRAAESRRRLSRICSIAIWHAKAV